MKFKPLCLAWMRRCTANLLVKCGLVVQDRICSSQTSQSSGYDFQRSSQCHSQDMTSECPEKRAILTALCQSKWTRIESDRLCRWLVQLQARLKEYYLVEIYGLVPKVHYTDAVLFWWLYIYFLQKIYWELAEWSYPQTVSLSTFSVKEKVWKRLLKHFTVDLVDTETVLVVVSTQWEDVQEIVCKIFVAAAFTIYTKELKLVLI